MSDFTHETAQTDFLKAEGIRYAYRQFGKIGKTPLLFLGYFNSNLDAWDPALTNSLAQKYDLILFDNAGAGTSEGQIAAAPTTKEQARAIMCPLYDALNEPAKKDVSTLLAKAAHPDYRSYHTNKEFLTRDQLAELFKHMGVVVPDLHWEIKDIQTQGDQIIVRGEATGTPKAEFWGTKPTGKGFKTMALDIFTVKNGKALSCYHVENWMAALE